MREIAATAGTSKTSVGAWRTGERVPEREARDKLFETYGIPIDAWDRAIGAGREKPEKPKPVPQKHRRPAGRPVSLADVDELLSAIREKRGERGLMVSEFAKLCSAETQAVALRAKLEQAQEDLEARYWESPQGKRLLERLVEALVAHPEAAAAVEEVLAVVAA